MIALELKDVGQAYLGRTVLDQINLTIAQGEVLALVGPSGCGKSSLAHIAAGLAAPRRGKVMRAYARHAVIFQEPALLPWATAQENIGFGLRMAGVKRRARAGLIAEAAQRVALLPEDLDKYPAELSGGMKQRAAIARALAIAPDFVFFDEPFTALDAALRRRMQDLVIETCAVGRLTGLFITHDLQEAARVANRIAVLDLHGRGILGARCLPGTPASRDDATVFAWAQAALRQDPLFRHIHDVDERLIA